jgi:ABC-type Fe3+-siderophore transport system permease subunit
MPQFATLVGRTSTGWAWIAQLGIAAAAGAVYGILAGRAVSRQLVSAGGIGLVYGVLVGAVLVLAVLPLASGGDLFNLDDRAMWGIGAFALFGVIVGVVYAVAGPRRRYYDYGDRRPIFGYITPASRRRRRRRAD